MRYIVDQIISFCGGGGCPAGYNIHVIGTAFDTDEAVTVVAVNSRGLAY